MTKTFSLFLLLFFALIVAGFPASAGSTEPKLIGTYGDWSAYSYTDGGQNVCYILSSPKKAVGDYKKRGEIFSLVTHRPGEKARNVFSVMAGYGYKPDSSVTVAIDGQKFVLFTHNDSAWAPDSATDKRLAAAMRKGKSMVVTGTSSKGTVTTDTYGLKGTSLAFDSIDKACPEK